MTARVAVLIGPGRSGKTARLVDEYRQALGAQPPGSCLWLAPTWQAGEDVRQRLLEGELRACFAPGVTTFRRLAEQVLRDGPQPVRMITRLMRRRLIGRVIGERVAAGRLDQLAGAARSGVLVALADDWIARQQRRELSPGAARAVLGAGISAHEEELVSLYEDYQKRLGRAALCDAESCFPAAVGVLRGKGDRSILPERPAGCSAQNGPVPFSVPWLAAVRCVVVDGFNDFTPAQHEILAFLADGGREVRISLDGESEPCREDLFCRPIRTLDELRRRHRQVEVQYVPRPNRDEPAGLSHLEQTLFRPPSELRPARSVAGLEILAAAGECGQIETLARRIKRLLVEGHEGQPVRPHQVAVVFRCLTPVDRLVAEVFGRHGIPFVLPAGPPLGSSPVFVTLRKRLRVGQGLDAMPHKATLTGWAKAWRGLCGTGFQPVAARRQVGNLSHDAAWAQLNEAVDESARLSRWLGEPAEELDRRESLAVLGELLESVRLKAPVEAAGRVRILSARGLGGLRVPYLFLAGLSEKSFPAGSDPSPDEDPALRAGDEMLLFYSVVTRATRRLVFSYPALDETGQPLQPSPYLEEVEQACGPGRIARPEAVDLSPIPAGEPFSAGDFRVKAVAGALEGHVSLLAGLVRRETSPGLAENLLAALETIHQRQAGAGFGPMEGMIGEAAAVASLFGPTRPFSPTELELYATCPYRFFLERVLRIEPPEKPLPETDVRARGQFLHQVLAGLHREVNALCGGPASPASLEAADYERLLAQAIASAMPAGQGSPLEKALAEIDRRVVREWLSDYRRQCEGYDKLMADQGLAVRPAHFEVAFGRESTPGDPLSGDRTLDFQLGDERIAICGRIDRIDVGAHAGRTVFSVIDYKSGDAPSLAADSVLRGLALQLPLYLLAAEKVLLADRNAAPIEAGYWSPGGGGYKARCLAAGRPAEGGIQSEPAWDDLREKLPGVLAALARGIRRGDFPVFNADDKCTGKCPFSTVCRIQQVRWLEKTWQPTAG